MNIKGKTFLLAILVCGACLGYICNVAPVYLALVLGMLGVFSVIYLGFVVGLTIGNAEFKIQIQKLKECNNAIVDKMHERDADMDGIVEAIAKAVATKVGIRMVNATVDCKNNDEQAEAALNLVHGIVAEEIDSLKSELKAP